VVYGKNCFCSRNSSVGKSLWTRWCNCLNSKGNVVLREPDLFSFCHSYWSENFLLEDILIFRNFYWFLIILKCLLLLLYFSEKYMFIICIIEVTQRSLVPKCLECNQKLGLSLHKRVRCNLIQHYSIEGTLRFGIM
jgi:hypothetical protein